MIHMCSREFPDSQPKEFPEVMFTSHVAGSGASNNVLEVTSPCFLFLISAFVCVAFLLNE